MVAIVGGAGLGLFNSSLNQLNGYGAGGSDRLGAGNDRIYVNASTGNLVIQSQDDYLAALGLDLAAVRTYNSRGQLAEETDNWQMSFFRRLINLPAAGATTPIIREGGDGHRATFNYVSTNLWRSTDGSGAHDELYKDGNGVWTYRDGSNGLWETYDASGRIVSQQTADTAASINQRIKLTFAYSGSSNRITQITDGTGQVTTLNYDANSNLTFVQTNPAAGASIRVRYGYDGQNRLTSVKVDLANPGDTTADSGAGKTFTTAYGYDGSSRRITSITQRDDASPSIAIARLEIGYQDLGGGNYVVSKLRQLEGGTTYRETLFNYDTADRRTDVYDPLGALTSYHYDGSDRLLKVVQPQREDGLRSATTYAYDTDGNVRQVVMQIGGGQTRTIDYTYDRGNLTEVRDSGGNAVSRTYSADDLLLTETVYLQSGATPSQPQTTRYVYDGERHLRYVISAEGRVTQHTYYDHTHNAVTPGLNRDGELASTTRYTGDTQVYAGAATLSGLDAWVDGLDKSQAERTDFAYDVLGQLISSTRYTSLNAATGAGTAGAVTLYAYSPSGELKTKTELNPDGSVTTAVTSYTYDGFGRVLTVTDASNRTSTYRYDDVNNTVVLTSDQTGGASGAYRLRTTSVYNKAGELITQTQTGSASGAATGGALGATQYSYDANGRLRMTTDPTGGRTHYFYDAAGRLVAQVNAEGELTESVYDGSGLLVRSIRYDGRIPVGSLIDGSNKPLPLALSDLRGKPVALAGQPALDLNGSGVGGTNTTTLYKNLTGSGAVAPNLVLSDDGTTLDSVLVTIDNIVDLGSETLVIAANVLSAQGLKATWAVNGKLGSLMLESDSSTLRTKAAYQTALRALQYRNAVGSPASYGTKRIIRFSISDGELGSLDRKAEVTISRAPLLQINNATAPVFQEGGQGVPVAPGLTLTDPDSSLVSVTATLIQAWPGDLLKLSSVPAGFSAVYANNTLTLTAIAPGKTLAEFQVALRNLVFQSTSENPNITDRSIVIIVNDGEQTHQQTATIKVEAINDAPTLSYNGSAGSYTENAGPTDITNGLFDISDIDSPRITEATVQLLGALDPAGEYLSVDGVAAAAAGINVEYNLVTGRLRLWSAVPVEQTAYENLLAGLSYQSLSNRPVASRSLEVRVSDGVDSSNAVTLTINITAANDAPVLDANGPLYAGINHWISMPGFGNNLVIGGQVSLSDPDGDPNTMLLQSATATIDGFAALAERLSIGATQLYGITVGPMSGGTLTLTGQATVAQYLEVLQTLTYERTLLGSIMLTDRVVQVKINDGQADSALSTINVLKRNSALPPEATTPEPPAPGPSVQPQQVIAPTPNLPPLPTETPVTGTPPTPVFNGPGSGATIEPPVLPILLLPVSSGTVGFGAPTNRVTEFVYDVAGRLVYTVANDTEGVDVTETTKRSVVEITYDGAGRIVKETRYAKRLETTVVLSKSLIETALTGTGYAGNIDNRITRHFYDADGLKLAVLDGEGYLVENNYDGAGRLIDQTRYATATAVGQRASGTLANLRPAADAANDQIDRNFYDGRGQLTASIDAQGYFTQYSYNSAGMRTREERFAKAVVYAANLKAEDYVSLATPTAGLKSWIKDYIYDNLGRIKTQEDATLSVGGTEKRLVQTSYSYNTLTGFLDQMTRGAELAVGANEYRSTSYEYDALGRVVKEAGGEGSEAIRTAADGTAVANAYAAYGSRHVYDLSGRRIKTTEASGRVHLYYYDNQGRLRYTVSTSSTAGQGEVSETLYNAFGEASSLKRYGATINLSGLSESTALGAVKTAVDALANAAKDRTIALAYTLRGQVKATTDAEGYLTQQIYNAFGEASEQRTQVKPAAGTANPLPVRIDTQTYDRKGLQKISATDSGGLSIQESFVYDAFGRAIQKTDALGRAWKSGYDRLGRVITTTDPLSSVAATTYDAFSQVLTQIDKLGAVTTYAYDTSVAGRRKVTMTTAEGVVVHTTYDRHGSKLKIEMPNGAVTEVSEWTYDRDGRLKTEIVDSGSGRLNLTTTNNYNNAGQLIGVTDQASVLTKYTYDAANRVLTRTVDEGTGNSPLTGQPKLNLITRYAYDAFGSVIKVTDAENVVTETVFDRKGQVSAVIVDTVERSGKPGPLKLATVYAYDTEGRVLTLKEGVQATGNSGSLGYGGAATRTTNYEYDKAGRRIRDVVDPAGLAISTSYLFDKNDNLIRKTDANANVWRYFYDELNRQVFFVDGERGVSETAYDRAGNVVRRTEYINALAAMPADGVSTATMLGTVVRNALEDRVTRYVYDADGQQIFEIDALGGTTEFRRDKAGRVVETVRYTSPLNLALLADGAQRMDVERARASYTQLWANDFSVGASGLTITDSSTVINYDATGGGRLKLVSSAGLASTASTVAQTIGASIITAEAEITVDVIGSGQYSFGVDNVQTLGQSPSRRHVVQVIGNKLYAIRYLGTATQEIDLGIAVVAGKTYVVEASVKADGSQIAVYEKTAGGKVLLAVDVAKTNWDKARSWIDVPANPIPNGARAFIDNMKEGRYTLAAADIKDRKSYQFYDAAGRKVYDVDTLRSLAQYRYDGTGRVTQETRYFTAVGVGVGMTKGDIDTLLLPANNFAVPLSDQTTKYAYDGAGRLTSTTDADNYVESYAYDNVGNRTRLTNKIGNQKPDASWRAAYTWNYEYDGAGRLINEIAPSIETTDFSDVNIEGLYGAGKVVTSPDGTNLYVISKETDSISIFKCEANGSLTYQGIVSNDTPGIDGLGKMESISFSADGKSAYVSMQLGLAVFGRTATGGLQFSQLLPNPSSQAVVSPDGKQVYSVANGIESVTVFNRNVTTGILSVAQVALGTSMMPVALVISSDGKQVYVASSADPESVHILDRNATTGLLTWRQSVSDGVLSSFTQGDVRQSFDGPTAVTMNSAGTYLYASNWVKGSGTIYTRSTVTGALTLLQTFIEGVNGTDGFANVQAIEVRSDNSQMLVLSDVERSISIYNRNPTTGKFSLSQVLRSGQNGVPEIDNPVSIVLSLDGNRAYIAEASNGSILVFQRDAAGQWSFVSDIAEGRGIARDSGRPTTHIDYDGLGNVLARTEGYGTTSARVTQYRYDARGIQVRVISPEVGVYAPGSETAEYLGRKEQDGNPKTQVTFDTLGQAIVSRNASGAYSYKIYDKAGRVIQEIDEERYLTQYEYDAFDNVRFVTRYATRLLEAMQESTDVLATHEAAAFDDSNPTSAIARNSSLSAHARIKALAAMIVSMQSAPKRTLETQFDILNRKIAVLQPTVEYYLPTAGTPIIDQARPVTRYFYNTFGELERQSILRSQMPTPDWVTTYFNYDARGNQTDQVDAQGFWTKAEYDTFGRLKRRIEYATAQIAAGAAPNFQAATLIGTAPGSSPGANNEMGYDRIISYTYDRLNRQKKETFESVQYTRRNGQSLEAVNGGSLDNRVSEYDAVGNLIAVTDAMGATTRNYYDALGRLTATVSPEALSERLASRVVVLSSEGGQTGDIQLIIGGVPPGSLNVVLNYRALGSAGAYSKVSFAVFDFWGMRLSNPFNAASGTYEIFFEFSDYAGRPVDVYNTGIGHDGKLSGRMVITRAAASTAQITVDSKVVSQRPLTTYGYDILGNMVLERRHAYGAASADAEGFTANKSSWNDQYTYHRYSALGWDLETIDAENHSELRSYDSMGRLTKLWRPVTDTLGVVRERTELYKYDRVGQQIETAYVNRAIAETQHVAVNLDRYQARFNAYGEQIKKGVNAASETAMQESAEYDVLGRLWKTNVGGVTKVYRYDLMGNATVELQLPGTPQGEGQGPTPAVVTDAAAAELVEGAIRTESVYDALGRLTEQRQAKFTNIVGLPITDNRFNIVGVALATKVTLGTATAVSGGFKNKITVTWPAPIYSVQSPRATITWRNASGVIRTDVVTIPTVAGESSSGVFEWTAPTAATAIQEVTIETQVSGQWQRVCKYSAAAPEVDSLLKVTVPKGTSISQVRFRSGENLTLPMEHTATATLLGRWTQSTTSDIASYRLTLPPGFANGSYVIEFVLSYPAGSEFGNPVSLRGELTVSSGVAGTGLPLIVQWQSAYGVAVMAAQTPVVRRGYDRWGNLLWTGDARDAFDQQALSANQTRYRYNHLNQVVHETQPETDVWTESGGFTNSTRDRPKITSYYDVNGRLIARDDARQNRTNWIYDSQGNLIRQIDPLGHYKHKEYDALGREIAEWDPLLHISYFKYDHLDQRVAWNRYELIMGFYPSEPATERYQFDESGNRVAVTNGVGFTTRYRYDTRGRLITLITPLAQGALSSDYNTHYRYDAQDRKIRETNGNTHASSGGALEKDYQAWSYDYFGRLTAHQNIAGSNSHYLYDGFGRLSRVRNDVVVQTVNGVSVNTHGAQTEYDYYENGWLKQIQQTGLSTQQANIDTLYGYDALGNRTHERLETAYINGTQFPFRQYNVYDELGRLSRIEDQTGYQHWIEYAYDAAGNRQRISTNMEGGTNPKELWYTYDVANRLLISQGTKIPSGNGKISLASGQGASFQYDAAGNRARTWTKESSGDVFLFHSYDGANRLLITERANNEQKVGIKTVSQRTYDKAGQMISYVDSGELGTTNSLVRSTTYNANGWVLEQKYSGRTTQTVSYTTEAGTSAFRAGNYDKLGNLKTYKVTSPGYNATYSYDYLRLNGGYSEARVYGQNPWGSGNTDSTYDEFGNRTVVTPEGEENRFFIYTGDGQVAIRFEPDKSQRYFYVNGQAVGDTGGDGTNVDSNYQPISDKYPAPGSGSYTVQQGDTLQSIALAVWGDATLWYLIADANGISDPSNPPVGQVLTIPTVNTNIRNAADVFKPYNAGEIVGDTTPKLPDPPPPPKKKCGGFLQIIVIAVAIVATVYTAGAAAGLLGVSTGAATTLGAGAAVLSGSAGLGAAALGAAAIGGAVGSAASQLAAKGLGLSDHFSWKDVALGGLTAAATAGIGAGLDKLGGSFEILKRGADGATWQRNVLQGALGSAASQGINVAFGKQESFSWNMVAASAVTSGLSGGTRSGDSALDRFNQAYTGNILADTLRSTAYGVLNRSVVIALQGHGKIDLASIAADSFGNALGNSIVGAMQGRAADRQVRKTQRDIADGGVDFIAEQMARTGEYAQAEIDAIRNAPETADLVGQARGIVEVEERYGKPYSELTDAQKAEAFYGVTVTSPPSANVPPGAAPLPMPGQISGPLEVTVVGGNPMTPVEVIASGLEIGANAINKFVDVVGGPERAAWFLGGVQAAIYGIPKTAVDMAVGKLIEPGVEFIGGKISAMLQGHVLNGTGSAESVKAVSDSLGGMAANMVMGTPSKVIGGAKSFGIAKIGHNAGPNAPRYETWTNNGGRVYSNPDRSVTYVRADGASLTYRDGYPEFEPHLNHPSGVGSVDIDQPFSSNRTSDYRAANARAGHPEWGSNPPDGYRWHHHQNGRTMQLVPEDIHDDFSHRGGVSLTNAGQR